MTEATCKENKSISLSLLFQAIRVHYGKTKQEQLSANILIHKQEAEKEREITIEMA